LLIIGIVILTALWPAYGFSGLAIIIFGVGIYDLAQKEHTILRNFPVLGHIRYMFELISPEIHQYFIENDTEGKPIDRNHRSYIYSRAKLENQTHPFGTQLDVEEERYKWMKHSIYPAKLKDSPPRFTIGGPDCKKPYSSSLLNVSAMSYGALSSNAVEALNRGAKAGNFSQSTGEGGISKYHLAGGDLTYQIGTGYFGCRDQDGNFSAEAFKERVKNPAVKMVEIKISQGAKPGHGGVLPAVKNTKEIAEIRGVEPHTAILSPPGHSAFGNAKEMMEFIQHLRELSGGLPIGIKLSVGIQEEFIELCEQMIATGIKPDFITIDGGEGGTGAAPIDFSNYVGMPWEKALIFAVDMLRGYDLKKDIAVITANKIITAFDIFQALCIGADVCNSARAMMLSIGCIQALRCDTNKCPTGVTTSNSSLRRGLVVSEKWKRVKNYHEQTLKEFNELFAASGSDDLSQLNRDLINKRVNDEMKSYEELYPSLETGILIAETEKA
jgi:glutamate synthase domain-containing protein 2